MKKDWWLHKLKSSSSKFDWENQSKIEEFDLNVKEDNKNESINVCKIGIHYVAIIVPSNWMSHLASPSRLRISRSCYNLFFSFQHSFEFLATSDCREFDDVYIDFSFTHFYTVKQHTMKIRCCDVILTTTSWSHTRLAVRYDAKKKYFHIFFFLTV